MLAGCAFHPDSADTTPRPTAGAVDGTVDGGPVDGAGDARGVDAHVVDAQIVPPSLVDYTGVISTAATITTAATIGDVEVVIVGWTSTASQPSVGDDRGSGFAMIASGSSTGVSCALYWERVTVAAATDTVAPTFATATSFSMGVADYTGVAQSGSPIDGVSAMALHPTTSADVTTTRAGDTIVAIASALATPTPGSGFTAAGSSQITLDEDLVDAAPGTYPAGLRLSEQQQLVLRRRRARRAIVVRTRAPMHILLASPLAADTRAERLGYRQLLSFRTIARVRARHVACCWRRRWIAKRCAGARS